MTSQLDWNQQVINEFRANGGRVGGSFEGRQLLLLQTIGAKSGQVRTIPLVYINDGEQIVIIASKGGSDSNPDWYHNLVANPVVTVELGDKQFQARTRFITAEPERTRLYNLMVERMPVFGEYAAKSKRTIPVMILDPIEPTA